MTRYLIVALVILTFPSCAPALRTGAAEDVVVEQLFFGRNLYGMQVVSDSAWSNFLSEVVTPRFPGGLTVFQASGQWRGADGKIEREASFVLELVHAPSAAADSNIVFIISEYKRRFQQEAVLRVVIPAKASY